MDKTGPELSRHLGSLHNSHVSSTSHSSYSKDIQRNTELDPEQQDIDSERIPWQTCELQLDNTLATLPHQQKPLSFACHLPHPLPSTAATSWFVYTTNYHQPTFGSVLTNSVHPIRYPTCQAPIFKIFHSISSAPAETLSQFYPSSNHQTFLHISQPNAAHPNIYFATKPEWITRTIPNPATECQLMMHPRCNHVLHDQPHFINQPIQQSFTSAEPCKLFQPNTRSPPIVWNCHLFRFRNLMGILSSLLFMIGSTFSKHLFTITDQPHKLTKSAACKTPFPETQKTSFEGTLVTLFSTTFRYRNLSLASVHCNTL